MIVKLLKRLGVKLVLSRWKDTVRNATSIIYGVVLASRKDKEISDQDVAMIVTQLKRIEKSIALVKVLDVGDDNYVRNSNKGGR